MSFDYECVETLQNILKNENNLPQSELNQNIAEYVNSIEINSNASSGFTPLFRATSKGEAKIVATLLEHGADPNITSKHSHSPLFWSAEKGQLDITKNLVNAGADVNLQDKNGKTPLILKNAVGF